MSKVYEEGARCMPLSFSVKVRGGSVLHCSCYVYKRWKWKADDEYDFSSFLSCGKNFSRSSWTSFDLFFSINRESREK